MEMDKRKVGDILKLYYVILRAPRTISVVLLFTYALDIYMLLQ
jgi:hypothetical protein